MFFIVASLIRPKLFIVFWLNDLLSVKIYFTDVCLF